MDLILILWSVGCTLWTIVLVYFSLDYRRKHFHLYLEQSRWLARAEKLNRQRIANEGN